MDSYENRLTTTFLQKTLLRFKWQLICKKPISGEKNVPTLNSWLATNLISGDTIGIDPWVYPKTEWDTMDRELRSQNISLIPIDANLVDRVWDKERPECTNKPIFQLPLKFAGKDALDKMKDVRKDMKNKQADVLVVSELDEVACEYLQLV